MTDEDQQPVADIEKLDTSKMTVEERLDRIESIIHALATHQTTLGGSLITCHGKILDLARTMNEAGVTEDAAFARGDRSGLAVQPAPLVNPGGHPLNRGK